MSNLEQGIMNVDRSRSAVPDTLDRLKAALADRYAIEREKDAST